MSDSRFPLSRVIASGGLLLASAIIVMFWGEELDQLRADLLAGEGNSVWVLTALFGLFAVSQILIIPTGTVMLLAAGALLGPVVGGLYYLGMIAAAPITYYAAASRPRDARRRLSRVLPRSTWRPLLGSMKRFQDHPVLATAMLRLLPVLPSAGAALLAGAAGLRFTAFWLGTWLSGWLRPVAISLLGYLLRHAVDANGQLQMQLLIGVGVVTLSTLALSALLARRILLGVWLRSPPWR